MMQLRFVIAALLFAGCHLHLGVPQSVIDQCRGNEKCITYCTGDDTQPFKRRYCKQLQHELIAGTNYPIRTGKPAASDPPKVRILDVSLTPLSTPIIAAQSLPAIVTVLAGLRYGTGFAVTEHGFIVTNLHVIEGQSEIAVVLPGGHTEQVSQVIAYDKEHDLAILHVSGVKTALPLGNGHDPFLGESVMTIGHPLGFTSTVATGILSGRRYDDEHLDQFQTSLPMAAGASGGPLMDEYGRVIGIMQAMILEAQNVSFAIPVEYLRPLLDKAITAPAPIPIAEFAKQTAVPESELGNEPESEPVVPVAPPVPPEVFKGCSTTDRFRIDTICSETSDAAKHLCYEETFSACAHLYLGAAMALEDKLSKACAGPRAMLLGGRTTTLKIADPEDQAKALRTLFESLGGGARETP